MELPQDQQLFVCLEVFHHAEVPETVEGLVAERQAADVGLEAAGVAGLAQGHAEGAGGEVEGEEGLAGLGADAATGFRRAAAAFDVQAGSREVLGDGACDAPRSDLPAIERKQSAAEASRQPVPVSIPLRRFGAVHVVIEAAGLAVVFDPALRVGRFIGQQLPPIRGMWKSRCRNFVDLRDVSQSECHV